MPPLPENNTAVYFVDYHANGKDHTVQFRYDAAEPGPPSTSPFIARVATVFADLGSYLPTDFAILGARYRASGSVLSFPAPVPSPTVTPTIAPQVGNAPSFISFVGRSVGGRRCRLSFTGIGVGPDSTEGALNDYRASTSELVTVATLVANLNGADFRAIDGLAVTWYPYANFGYNAYWQRQTRRG